MKQYTPISLRHLDLSDNFFDLVQAALEENIKQGNKTTALMKPTEDFQKILKQYRQQTKWSDDRILIPILFNFFHGIELFLKGIKYLYQTPKQKDKPNHKLQDLLNDFRENNPGKLAVANIIEYYIFPDDSCPIIVRVL